ncbi:peptide/nickel transport system permease protein [Dinghuibacter silviterrae]|uniref:Peptide/nickel transport system permease protein n=2 Tax=Dinghuibacter silviterrae TaxID=1539049 RepID=A0A4R8DNM1_9BACT|nr:peptide/nickel transport system permease protein [Dinghuibacter silviterrae]
MASLLVIALAFGVAAFAYFLAPDHSPFANRMVVEIGGKPPGYTQQFLLLKRPAAGRTDFLQRLWSGAPDTCIYVPITRWSIAGDSLHVDKYIDDGLTEPQAYALQSIDPYRNGRYLYTQRFYLGTDRFGRDVLSRLIIGTRVSLSVGLVAVALSLTIGIFLGALGGYYGGKTDDVIVWFMNIVWSIPTLLLVFAITFALGKGFWQVFVAVGLTLWVNVARTLRGQVLALRHIEYVEAGRALGFSDARIITRHILPNVIGPVLVISAANFASAIVIEAGLSFLGVGVQPPQPSWGLMIKENYSFIITHNPSLAIVPGVAIMVLVLAFNLLGNGLRDAMDVRS